MRFGKIGNFNNSLRFRAPFGKILRVLVSKMFVKYASILFQIFVSEFSWGKCIV